jgi:hypothetical protein
MRAHERRIDGTRQRQFMKERASRFPTFLVCTRLESSTTLKGHAPPPHSQNPAQFFTHLFGLLHIFYSLPWRGAWLLADTFLQGTGGSIMGASALQLLSGVFRWACLSIILYTMDAPYSLPILLFRGASFLANGGLILEIPQSTA